MSPVQFQKRLRLTEARQILLAEKSDAASVAYPNWANWSGLANQR
jgi:transcriptional regulator GlxA family with amidase domain